MADRFTVIPETSFVWIRNGQVLLLRRFNTGWEDGKYCFPAGHVESGEASADAMVREVFEETGIKISTADLEFVHVQHRWHPDMGGHSRIGFYFKPKVNLGEPHNTEPHKCDDLGFFPLDRLPEMVPPFRAALDAILRGETYSEFGWEGREAIIE
jgi:8-oxo-dGTP diphosphatase